MTEPKTKPTKQNPRDFLKTIEPEQKRNDCFQLLELFERITGERAVMWGPSIVGFGMYHYKSERSSQEGNWPLTGFSPRKQSLTLYVMSGSQTYPELFKQLGKHTTSKACLYIKKLSDVNMKVLEEIIDTTYQYAKKQYNLII